MIKECIKPDKPSLIFNHGPVWEATLYNGFEMKMSKLYDIFYGFSRF